MTNLQIFPMDIRAIDWETYIINYNRGGKKYILKEKEEDLPKALHRMKM